MVNKITLMPGDIWRLIIGVMYSGGPETSHGDSWVMALMFYTYMVHVTTQYPQYSTFIYMMLERELIRIIIYGDDHVWCCPTILHDVINVKGFAKFLKEYWRMELRDYKEYSSFISEVDLSTGTFIKRGPKFLKRYFIESFIPGAAPILPFKEPIETLLRMCTVSEEDGYPGLLLKSIGQAWDTMGTNLVAYESAKLVFELATSHCVETPRQIVERLQLSGDHRKLVKNMYRKFHLSREEMMSFPSIEALQSRHVLIPELINNKKKVFVI